MQRILRDNYEQLHTNKLDNLEEMDKLLESYNLPRLNHEDTENLNRIVTNQETESVIKNSQHIKFQDKMASLVNFTKHLKNECQSFSTTKNSKRGEHSQTYFMRPALLWYQKQIRIL